MSGALEILLAILTRIARITMIFLVAFSLRAAYILYQIHKDGRRCGGPVPAKRRRTRLLRPKLTDPVSTLVVLGSGGHTAEMLQLLRHVGPDRYAPLVHVVASSDTTSEKRVRAAAEASPSTTRLPDETYRIPRSREVGQSYVTSVGTTLRGLASAFWIVGRTHPSLVICNGPGTCLPVVVSAFVWRVLGWCEGNVVFVESFCRVKSLSLTGKLLYPIVDRFVVHWDELQKRYPRTEVIGTFIRPQSQQQPTSKAVKAKKQD